MADVLNRYLEAQSLSETKLSVWSLVVTIFGDAITPRGGVFRLGALQKITDHIGIGNNALRTAMSRLASDGWLERQRIGRASFYKPSQMAKREYELASKVIYNFFPQNWNKDWVFAVSTNPEGFCTATKTMLHNAQFAFHNRKLAIAPDLMRVNCQAANNIQNDILEAANTHEISVFNAQACCEKNTHKLLKNITFHHDCIALYDDFSKSASILLDDLNGQNTIDSLDALLLRLLLLHQWRRIVLKDVHWPSELRSENWPGFLAQSLISKLYHQLLEPSENWLSQLDATPNGKLPKPGKSLLQRFKL